MKDMKGMKIMKNTNLQSLSDYKKNLKIQRAQRNKELKASLIPGTIVRTVFSYEMTFNYFYKVIENKGSKYKLQKLTNEWVDGDAGFTGSVKAGKETDKFIEGKLTVSGLKIDDLYGEIININDTFYENHID